MQKHTVKVGDTVAAFRRSEWDMTDEQRRYNEAHPDYVKVARVTPSGQIVLENGQRFNAVRWYGGAHHAIRDHKAVSPRYDRIVAGIENQAAFEEKLQRDALVGQLYDIGNGYRRRSSGGGGYDRLTQMEAEDVRHFEHRIIMQIEKVSLDDPIAARITKMMEEAWEVYERTRLRGAAAIARDVLSLADLQRLVDDLDALNKEIDARDAAVTETGRGRDCTALTTDTSQEYTE